MGTAINNTFSLPRFGLVVKKDFIENWKFYALGALLIFGVLVLFIMLFGYDVYAGRLSSDIKANNMDEFRIAAFSGFLYTFAIVLASISFKSLKNKTGRIESLMLPASHFEKFIMRWLITVVLYPVIYIVIFVISDAVCVVALRAIYPEEGMINMLDMSDIYTSFPDISTCVNAYAYYLCIQAFYMLGSVVMPKLSFVKTSAVLFVLVLLYVWTIVVCNDIFFSPYRRVGLEPNQIGLNVCLIVFAVAMWVVSYFRYKESEVIHRLI